MNVAIILAGGLGSRLGAEKPKQFIDIFGKPIIVYTVEIFQNHKEIDVIEIVCIKSHIDYMKELVIKYKLTKVKLIVEGGVNFQESVLNGINGLKKKCNDNDTVLVHFGASPFVGEDIITDAIKVCQKKGNAISTTPFYLLSGIKGNNESSDVWIDRDTIVCMNTPHAFNYKFVRDIYKEAIDSGIIDEVEPHTTTLMYKMNKRIYFSKGSQTNIKITTKDDLDLFKGYILYKSLD